MQIIRFGDAKNALEFIGILMAEGGWTATIKEDLIEGSWEVDFEHKLVTQE